MKNVRTILVTGILIAYLAVFLKLLVFKNPSGMLYDTIAYNLVPFKTILPYLTGYPNWIVARDNLLGNVIPFMPLGLLAPFLYHRLAWKHALAAGFAVSLCIEVLQLALRAGTFDVDDLLLNTLGAMLGYGLFAASMRIIQKVRC